MKKIIATIDDAGNLTDDNGLIVMNIGSMSFKFKEFEEKESGESSTVAQMVSLGVTTDDLIKMRASGLI